MKNTLGIDALNIQNFVVDNLCHCGSLPDLIGAGINIPCDPIHDHLELPIVERFEQIPAGIHIVTFNGKVWRSS